jgi:O-antigen/teichoic acid export membrane protein
MPFYQLFNSCLSITSQITANVVVFMVLARVWGPELFGQFVFSYSISSVLMLIVDFGYQQRNLRTASINAKNIPLLAGVGIITKAYLVLFLVFFLQIVNYFFGFLPLNFYFLFLSFFFVSFGDFFISYLRATGKFAPDARASFISNLFLIILIYYVVTQHPKSIFLVNISYVIARFAYLALSVYAFHKSGYCIAFNKVKIKKLFNELSELLPYFGDIAVGRLLGNLDIILLSAFSNAYSVGLYQSAQKIMQGVLPFAQVVNNVFLPIMSRQTIEGSKRKRIFLYSIMTTIGGLSGLVLIFFSKEMVSFLYGPNYMKVASIVPIFGIIVFLRYVTAAYAIEMTSSGYQRRRLIGNILSLFIFIISALILIPPMKEKGVAFSLLASSVFLALFMGISLRFLNSKSVKGQTT